MHRLLDVAEDHARVMRDLGRETEAREKAELERGRLRAALVTAEAALSDIGDADREPGDDLAWCEQRAAEALPTVRAALVKVTR